ncbi:MAG: prolipoprotein diacylglyceryl transferase family protein, partial [Patescibacteria group bacterium]
LGAPTKLPWGIEIPFNARPVGYKLYTTYHPLFLYESLLNLILFVFLYLVFINKFVSDEIKFKKQRNGTIALIYLIGFSLIRLFTEPLLLNSWKVGVFPMASVVSFVILTLSTIVLASMYIPLVIPRSKLPTKSVVVKREIKKSKSQIKKFRIQRKRKSK